MNPLAVFTRRVRGFRVIDIAALLVIVVTALASYAFKTMAGATDQDADGLETQIVAEQKRVRLLQAEIARLEEPGRVEALSTQYLGLTAVSAKQEIGLGDLQRIARPATPAAPPTAGAPS